MRFLHTSDLHLSSPLTAKLSPEQADVRKKEIFRTFVRMCEEAKIQNCTAIVIAGDLFDSVKVRLKDALSFTNTVKSYPEITFLYLGGNHEKNGLIKTGISIPDNLYIFGDEWTYLELSGVTFAGRSRLSPDMFSDFKTDASRKTVVVLHGALTDIARGEEEIGIYSCADLGIDYMALGHYHKYTTKKIDSRGVAVYSGTPEGRGFDEAHECGFVLVDIEKEVHYEFLPFSSRRIWDIDFDISGFDSFFNVECKLLDTLSGLSSNDLVRVRLVGKRNHGFVSDKKGAESRIGFRFFYFEIIDQSREYTDTNEYKNDKTLKGEFIRLVLGSEELSDEEKDRTVRCGISALLGENFEF